MLIKVVKNKNLTVNKITIFIQKVLLLDMGW